MMALEDRTQHAIASAAKPTYHSIQLLRFIAATAVVVHHAFRALEMKEWWLGAAGVDIFFVISGFIMGVVVPDSEGAREFLVKRFTRVYPPYWIATLLFVGMMLLVKAPAYIPDIWYALHSVALIPIYGHDWSPIYWPAWSVAWEIYFYLVFALCIALFGKDRIIAAIILVGAIAVMQIPVPWVPGKIVETEFGVEFCLGLLLALLSRNFASKSLGCLALLSALVLFFCYHNPAGVRVMTWGLPSCLLVLGFVCFEHAPIVHNRFCRYAGDCSYGLYLTHWTVLASVVKGCQLAGWTVPPNAASILLISACAVLFSIPFHFLLEKPATRAVRRVLGGPRLSG